MISTFPIPFSLHKTFSREQIAFLSIVSNFFGAEEKKKKKWTKNRLINFFFICQTHHIQIYIWSFGYVMLVLWSNYISNSNHELICLIWNYHGKIYVKNSWLYYYTHANSNACSSSQTVLYTIYIQHANPLGPYSWVETYSDKIYPWILFIMNRMTSSIAMYICTLHS